MMVSARKRHGDETLAEGHPAPTSGGGDPAEEEGLDVVLVLDDLLRDVNGEVVLFNDSGMRTVGLVTAAAVVDDGTVGRHVTADGVDVAGFRFYLFEGGLKLFYPPDLDLLLIRDRKPPR
jgi:hypothetical protein